MSGKSRFRELIKYRAGAVCLIGILTATFMHTTTFMAQFFYNNLVLGAIAAFAIDAGVVAMSIFKDELMKDGELAWMVRIVTSLVLLASGIANMSEGFLSAYGIVLTTDNLMSLDILTWSQWLAGTVIFPVLAYVMCDTIGTRNLVQLHQAEAKKRKAAAPQPAADADLLAKPNAKRQDNKAQRMARLEQYVAEHGYTSLAKMADAIGVSSKDTVSNYLDELGIPRPSSSKNGVAL